MVYESLLQFWQQNVTGLFLRQINPIRNSRNLQFLVLIYFKIILPSTSSTRKWSLPFSILSVILYQFIISFTRVT
jgi:hypothetical protein